MLPRQPAARLLIIAARVTAIAGIGFLSLFALDVFEPGVPPLQIVVALIMHLLPSLFLLAILVLAWRFPLVGGVYLTVALLPFLFPPNEVWVNAILAAPLALTGILFLAGALAKGS